MSGSPAAAMAVSELSARICNVWGNDPGAYPTGLPVSVALLQAVWERLIYTFVTKRKVPVYLGSSFAYISAVVIAIKAMGGSVDAAQTGLMLVGVIYVVALIVRVIGKEWIDKLSSPS